MTADATWAAVDWGSTNVRAYLLDDRGQVLGQTRASMGSKTTSQAAYRAALEELLGALGMTPERILLAGMVGSRAGWVEVPYCDCPAGVSDLAARTVAPPQWPGARIVPGLSCRRGSGSSDVMRGEEVQCSAALQRGARADSVCLPGTHSKWVRLAGHRISEFTTFCTGELFDTVRRHTLVGALIPPEQALAAQPGPGFEMGLQRVNEEPGLLSALFSVRADSLLGAIAPEQSADFLSGILIGAELRETGAAGMLGSVLLISDGDLALRYTAALEFFGAAVKSIDSADAFVAGAALIAGQINWG